ncbi:hypothetical protein IMZ48_08815, partial [Candidatus Bathyarchaeota archaeon]|nr:hypothetical protein [Candidatus Bathyarchaeota archaeon]
MSSTMTEVIRDPGLSTGPKSMTLLNYQRSDPASFRTQRGLPLPPRRSLLPGVLEKDKDTPDNHVRRDGR